MSSSNSSDVLRVPKLPTGPLQNVISIMRETNRKIEHANNLSQPNS